jgi:N-methylhydantoinase B/oxoprolinase/acetone carboxylase alpha subunit
MFGWEEAPVRVSRATEEKLNRILGAVKTLTKRINDLSAIVEALKVQADRVHSLNVAMFARLKDVQEKLAAAVSNEDLTAVAAVVDQLKADNDAEEAVLAAESKERSQPPCR